MSWYYNDVDGMIFQKTGIDKFLQDREIQIERNTPVPQNNFGPFHTEAEAQAFKNAHPATGLISGIHSAAHGLNQSANPEKALGGLAAIGDFFARLADPHTWIRVAEVLIGAGLIFVSLAHLQGATKGIGGKIAKRIVP